MAIRPLVAYPGQTDASDPGYPHGKAQNQNVVGEGTGTPLEAKWVNDVWGFLQALLNVADVTPSGNPDKVGASDYVTAIATLIDAGDESLSERIDAVNAALGAIRTITRILPLRALDGWMTPADGEDVAVSYWAGEKDSDYIHGHNAARRMIDIGKYIGPGESLSRVEMTVDTYLRTGDERLRMTLARQRSVPTTLPSVDGKSDYTDLLGTAYANAGGRQVIAIEPSSPGTSFGAYLELRASASTPPAGDVVRVLKVVTTRPAL